MKNYSCKTALKAFLFMLGCLSVKLSINADNINSFHVWPSTSLYDLSTEGRLIQKNAPSNKLFLWRVNGESSTVYLMGSIHILKKSNYPLKPLYEYAYDQCDQLVLEAHNEITANELNKRISLDSNQHISDYITDSTYKWIRDFAIDNDYPRDTFDGIIPKMVGTQILYLKAANIGYKSEFGVDNHFRFKAESDLKPIYGLEGKERYDKLFSESLEKQGEKLDAFVLDIKRGEFEKSITSIANPWLNLDHNHIKKIAEDAKKDIHHYNNILRDRNIAWIPEIEGYLKQENKVTLVIAGAAHSFGEHSVLSLLEGKGHKITQIDNLVVPSISLEEAIANNNLGILKQYLLYCPNLNITLQKYVNWKPMHEAAQHGTTEAINLLIENGAIVDAYNHKGYTPFHIACLYGKLTIAKYLIQKGAKIDAVANNMNTPLHNTAELGLLPIMELLVANGADVDVRNSDDGWTPLHNAVKNADSIKHLLKNGANINAKSFNGETPLHFAAKEGRMIIVELLILNGANTELLNNLGESPIDVAIRYNHSQIAEYIRLNRTKKTLFQAVEDNDIDSLNKHIAANSDLNQRDEDNWTPLLMASFYGFLEFAKILIDNGALIDAGGGKNGFTSLHIATAQGHTHIITLLLSKNANIDANDQSNKSPLHYAALLGKLKTAQILIENNAKIDHRDIYEETPLHSASSRNQSTFANYLLKNGALINAKNINGWTPLHLSSFYGFTDVAETLIGNGAKTDLVTNAGETALDMAIRQNHTEIQKLLKTDAAPVIVKQPQSTSVPIGMVVETLMVTAKGENLKYQWYKDNQKIDGAANSTYVIFAAFSEDEGEYHVTVSNESGTVTSETAMIKIRRDETVKISAFKYAGQFQFEISGFKGATFLIEASTDLKLWSPIGEFKNREGTVDFSDRTSPLFKNQYYRVKVVE